MMIVAKFAVLIAVLLKVQSAVQFLFAECSVVSDISKDRVGFFCTLKQSKKTLGQELQEDFLNCVTLKTTPIFFSDRTKVLTCRSSLTSHKAGILEIIIIY